MESGGGDFQSALGVVLAPYVCEVGVAWGIAIAVQVHTTVGERFDGGVALQVVNQLSQGFYRINFHTVHQRGLGGIYGGHVGGAKTLFPGHPYHRQDAGGVAQSAVEGKFTEKNGRLRGGLCLTGAEQDADGDGQIVGGAGLFQIGWSQVHRDAAHGEFAAAVAHGGANPLFGLLHRGIGQPHNVESGQARGNVGFSLDYLTIQTHDGAGLCSSQH